MLRDTTVCEDDLVKQALTMGPVVARPAVNGGIRYSSVRQLFHPPAEPGEIGQTPFAPGSFPVRTAFQRSVNSQQAIRS